MTELVASPNCCEEAHPTSGEKYIPCNRLATTLIYSPVDQRTMRMCSGCAYHSVKNRGMQDMGPYEPTGTISQATTTTVVHNSSGDDVFSMAAEDSVAQPVTEDKLETITRLANLQLELQSSVERMELDIKEEKEKLRRVQEQDLPEALDAVGMSDFTLKSGFKIAVSPFYNASIPGERKDEAYKWFDDNGHGGMIKAAVEISFSRGEIEFARQFIEWLNTQYTDLNVEFKQAVHWQTLRAFVKEQVESGAALPIDLLGVFVGRKAKITQVK